MMREKCSSLLDLVHKHLNLARNFEPRMFVSDHFTSLRNEIDLETETRLIEIEEKSNAPGKEQSRDQAWDHNAYNSARQSMIDELKLQESELLSNLKQPSEFENFSQSLLRVGEKVSEIEAAVERRQANDWSNLKRLTRVYLEIEDLLDAFRSKALNNKTFIFKADFLNPLGALIVFDDVYLNEAEAMFIKSKYSTPYAILYHLKDFYQIVEKYRTRLINDCSHQTYPRRVYKKSTLVGSQFGLFVKHNSKQLAQKTVVKISQDFLEQTTNEVAPDSIVYFGPLKNLDIIGCGIEILAPKTFEYLKNLTKLMINYNHLRSINKETFAGLSSLKSLTLVNNKLRQLDIDCFDELENLDTLVLNWSQIEHLKPMQFSQLTKLSTLEISQNKLKRIKADLEEQSFAKISLSPFYNLTNLSHLSISMNEIASVNGWFEGLPNLKNLNLMQNRLTELDQCLLNPDMMDTKLEQLNLSLNRISRIHSDAFRNLGQLKVLLLQNNYLRSVESCFQYLYSLIKLVLKSNQIERIGSGSLTQLVNLEFLDLSMNRISNLDENMFESLTKLETLNLDHNEIMRIKAGHFKGLSKLKTLSLSSNRITFDHETDQDIFQHFVSLTNLDLSGNMIKAVRRSTLGPSLKQLTSLTLSDNQISEIEENAFINLKSLECLILEYNQIRSVNMKMFQGLDKLNSLYLSSNLISSLQEYSFINLLNLEILLIDSNLIDQIHVNAFNCLFKLHQLNLSSNCIERLEDRVFECLAEITDLYLNSNQISSISSSTFLGLGNLSTLNLTENRIDFLPDDVFNHTPKIQQLFISLNLLKNIHIKSLKNLDCLQRLNMSQNQIETLDDDPSEYEKLAHLSQIQLNNNQLKYIRPDTFSRLVSLSQLILFGGKLDNLDERFLDSCESLSHLRLNSNHLRRLNVSKQARPLMANALSLNWNKFRRIEPGQFERFHELTHLDLSSNKIDEIDPDAFKNLEHLQNLTICSNLIRKVHANAFEGMLDLNSLNFNFNCLRGLEPNCLVKLNKLNTLSITHNLIKRISDVLQFTGFDRPKSQSSSNPFLSGDLNEHPRVTNRAKTRVSYLDLSSNYIRDLSDIENILKSTNDSSMFAELETFDMNRNFLSEFNADTEFLHFPGVTQISLSYNDIERLRCHWELDEDHKDSGADASCFNKLTSFFIDHNRLKSIDRNFFAFYMAGVKKINLNWNSIEDLDDKVFNGLKSLNTLELSRNKLKALNSAKYFEDNQEIFSIHLSQNQLESLHKDLFKEQRKMTSVFLNFNNLQSVPASLFSNATSLKTINLSNNLIESLDDSTFATLHQLDSLDLSSNKLNSLGFLTNLASLKKLNLTNNLLEELKKNSFAGLTILQDLNLSNNKIKRLDSGIFNQLSSLEILNLNNNCIEAVEQDAFSSLTHLSNLFLRANPLKDIDMNWFTDLKNLKVLGLEKIEAAVIRSDQAGFVSLVSDTRRLPILDNLSLIGTDLGPSFNAHFFKPSSLQMDDFQMMIKTLHMSDCRLNELHEGSFSSLVYLEELSLSKNQLKGLRTRTFEGLHRLKTLFLEKALVEGAFDQLVADDIRPFDTLENLEIFGLEGNHIQRLNSHLFARNRKLKSFSLKGNFLTQIETRENENPFENMKRLEFLDLSENQLTHLSHSWLRNLETLEEINLSKNRIVSLETKSRNADVRSSPFFYNSNIMQLNLSGNELLEITRENFKNLKKLSDLNLSSNKISRIDNSVLDEIQTVVNVDLSDNELDQINTKVFENLDGLTTLNLEKNKIKQIVIDYDRSRVGDDFRLFENLKRLHLSHNKLKEFDVFGMNLNQSRSLTNIHLNANDLIDQEKLMRDLSNIRTLKLVNLAGNANLKKIKTSWMMLELDHLKYLHFDGEIQNDVDSSPEDRDAFFLNLFNVQRDIVFQDDRYREPIEGLKADYSCFEPANLYITERALKAFRWKD